ncbi:MAG: protein kinase [Lachnospiraceae bacterium]|nr:protein kinase [Lachnospiraceae bacterium]
MINRGVRLNNRYVIDRVVGEGGGGVVYKAFDSNLQNYVVVKQIKESASSLLESRAEADILKGLKHENLPKVLDFFEDHGKIYTVIDFIEGVSLSDAVKREGRFPQKLVLAWARQLAQALAYLHSQRIPIVHSDIKPGNIMWNMGTGSVCLIDFNISLAFHKGQKNATWVSGGYSPPEQYRTMELYCNYLERMLARATRRNPVSGNASNQEYGSTGVNSRPTRIFDRRTFAPLAPVIQSRVDERSDVYSFGATLYHLLTGRKPEVNFLNIIPISRYDIPLSEGFCHIIEKCMEIDPNRRYQNGQELLYALEHIYELDSEYQAYKKRRVRNRILCASLFAAGIAMTAGGVLLTGREQVIAYRTCVQEAEQLLEDFQYDEAQEYIQKAQKIQENRVEADELELRRRYLTGDYEGCIQAGLSMLDKKQYHLEHENDRKRMGNLYYLIGSAFLESEESKEAVPYFEEAFEYEDENPRFFRDYAISLARCGRVEEAEEVLSQASKRKLDDDSIAFAEGEICYAKQDYLSAQKSLEEVIGRTKDEELRERAILLLNRMYIQCGTEYLDTAVAMLEKEMARAEEASGSGTSDFPINPNFTEALAKDYLLRFAGGSHPDDQILALNQYIRLYNSGYRTMRIVENIGILYRETGKQEAARKMAEELLDRYPENYRGYKLLAFLELDKQQALPGESRNYKAFRDCYEKARERYEKEEEQSDEEMQFLDSTCTDLQRGGWE